MTLHEQNVPTTMLDIALAYVERGYPIFPLYHVANGRCSCGSRDCGSPGKHPRTYRGFKDATLNPDKVSAWWTRWPNANIGMPTGAWCWVLDIDPRNGGDETLTELERKNGFLPVSAESKTGGGGRHILFAYPGCKVTSRSNVFPGIDVKGFGGYVVLPPSTHVEGLYRWIRHPEVYETADAPDWLLDMVVAKAVAA